MDIWSKMETYMLKIFLCHQISIQTINFAAYNFAVSLHYGNCFVFLKFATENFANCIFTQITIGRQCRYEQLCALRVIRINLWLRDFINNRIKDHM